MRLPSTDRGQRTSALTEASAHQPRSASFRTRCGTPARLHATEAALHQARPGHPMPSARTPERSRQASTVPVQQPFAPKCDRVTRHSEQARRSAIVPLRGHVSILRRPKTTEATKSSTVRWSCSLPAARSAGKPAIHSTLRSGRSQNGTSLSINRCPKARVSGRDPRESRAQPPERSEEPSNGLATRVAEALNQPLLSKPAPRRRSSAAIRQPKLSSCRLLRLTAETGNRSDCRCSSSGNYPRMPAGSTRRIVQRAAPYLLTRPQAADSSLDRLHRPKTSTLRSAISANRGQRRLRSNGIRPIARPSTTEHDDRPDVPRTAHRLRHPKDRQIWKPPAARVLTTPPMGFGAFRRKKPW